METPPLSILKKLGRLPNPKYGNIFDIFRKQTPPSQQQPQQQQPQNNNNNDTNIKISSQEEVSPATTITSTMSTMSTDLDSMSTPTATPSTPIPTTPTTPTASTLLTEDTGKILEKAICDAYGIPFKGPFKYSQAAVDALIPRVSKLKTDYHFPQCHHTAESGARYDFTSEDGTQYLSAKSNKIKGNKVAPQVIGQPSSTKFCQLLGIDPTIAALLVSSPPEFKKYIQENIATILPVMWEHTFSCPIIYYRERGNRIQFIRETHPAPVDWSSYTYTWTQPYDKWNSSATLKISQPNEKPVSIAEFQFHTNRNNHANRWDFPAILKMFHTRFTIVEL